MYSDKITPSPKLSGHVLLKTKKGRWGGMMPEDGFTLVELMVTMVVFVFAIVAASNIFTGVLNQFKQQSRIAESNIEGIVGLEMLRHDVEQAGIGLPWNLNGVNYNEAAVDTAANDDNGGANSHPPRPVVVLNNAGLNNSDILAIKAANIGISAAAQKWTYITNYGCTAASSAFAAPNMLRSWGASASENPNASTDHMIIINPSQGATNQNVLQNNAGVYDVQLNNGSFTFNACASNPSSCTASPLIPFEPNSCVYPTYVAYDISSTDLSSTGSLRMPFNRADYYIKRPADVPARCQANTGVLYKGTVKHANGLLMELPLLDCVLDMQVVFGLDSTGSGAANTWVDGINDAINYPANVIRSQLKEIRIYLIVQEGQKDTSYTYVNPDPNAPTSDKGMIYVKDPNMGNVYGATKNGYTVPDLNYRWKLRTIVISPYNLK